MDYKELLEKAMEKVPEKAEGGERFELPRIDAVRQGNMVVIRNFGEIVARVRRTPKHLMKFLTKELAVPGTTDGKTARFQGRLSLRMIKSKLELYVKEYVFCKVCGKPDTKIVKEGRIEQMKCEACGAKSAVRKM